MKVFKLTSSLFLLFILLISTTACVPLMSVESIQVGQIIPKFHPEQVTQLDLNNPIPKPGYIFELMGSGKPEEIKVFVDSLITAEILIKNSKQQGYCYNLRGDILNNNSFVVSDYLPTSCN
jgi:hypothetical protein